jgi:hypothetical protein
MDKVKKYQDIITSLLNEYATYGQSTQGVTRQVIIDKDHNHYQLVTVGWRDSKDYVYVIAFHFDIIEGKIWIQQNNTEAKITDELIERGVPSKDIVLGFQSPRVRELSGFAVA